MPCGGGLVVYLCGGGAGRLLSWPLTPLVGLVVLGLEGAGDEETSRSMSMGVGVGWSAILERRFRCSGGRLSGCCASSSYLDERRDECECDCDCGCDLSDERRVVLLLVRSRSLTRECGVALSGDEGGVPGLLLAGLRGCSVGVSWVWRRAVGVAVDFLEGFLEKMEGRTIEAKVGASESSGSAICVTEARWLQPFSG